MSDEIAQSTGGNERLRSLEVTYNYPDLTHLHTKEQIRKSRCGTGKPVWMNPEDKGVVV